MAINSTTANSHLRSVRSTLNNLADAQKIQNAISEHALDLFNILGEKKIDVDSDLKVIVDHIKTKLGTRGNTFITVVSNEIRNIDTQLAGLPTNKGNRDAIKSLNDKKSLLTTISTAGGNVTDRANEITALHNYISVFDINGKIEEDTVDVSQRPIALGGAARRPQNLQNKFFGGNTLTTPPTYNFTNEHGETLLGDATNGYKISIGGIEYTIKGLNVTGTPHPNQLSIDQNNFSITPIPQYPFELNLHVAAAFENVNVGGETVIIKESKPLKLTLNNGAPLINMDTQALRETQVNTIEGDLDRDFLEQRLRQEYENRFNTVQRTAFEKVLEKNPEFAKLNQTQKDRLYERMQDIGPLINAVDINLGTDSAGNTYGHTIDEIIFSPGNHEYSTMPNEEDYDTFRGWLSNQTPKDVLTDADKYRQRLRNGLVASLDDGETHYTSYFNDVLKKFTDDAGVQTTLNKTLLEFINDTNNADHVDFDTRLDGMSEAMTPETTTSKRRYQRLAFWTQGEQQNRQSLAQGQSNTFKTESITAGGQTFSYSGEIAIKGAQSVTMSLTMKDGKKQVFTAGNPGALVRNLLTNPEIEPPHARFHAGLSVAKSVVKIMRGMGISLRTAITPEMMDTIPAYARAAIERNDNPMLEITEEGGKLVAKVFNLDLDTYRKENEEKLFDEQEFVASQSVRDLRQGVESLLVLTNQTMNSVYRQYRSARFSSGLRPGLLRKSRRGGLRNMYKKLSFSGGSVSAGGKSLTVDCKNGLFTFSGGGLKKPLSSRNIGDLLAYNKELRGLELKTLQLANEKMLGMYQEKLNKQERLHNYGVLDEENHRVYVYDKHGNLGYYDSNDQTFVRRRRQYTSGRRYGRITDEHMPQRGFTVIKEGNSVVDQESYNNFLLNETLVGSMVRSMSRTHRAWTTWAPW